MKIQLGHNNQRIIFKTEDFVCLGTLSIRDTMNKLPHKKTVLTFYCLLCDDILEKIGDFVIEKRFHDMKRRILAPGPIVQICHLPWYNLSIQEKRSQKCFHTHIPDTIDYCRRVVDRIKCFYINHEVVDYNLFKVAIFLYLKAKILFASLYDYLLHLLEGVTPNIPMIYTNSLEKLKKDISLLLQINLPHDIDMSIFLSDIRSVEISANIAVKRWLKKRHYNYLIFCEYFYSHEDIYVYESF